VNPIQVLECQADFVRRAKDPSDKFKVYLRGCFSTGYDVHGIGIDDEDAHKFQSTLLSTFENGEAYQVTPDMTDLVEFAASKLDASDRHDVTLPPTPYGIVRLDKPIPVYDARGQMMLASWLTWAQISYAKRSAFDGEWHPTRGIFITAWNDTVTDKDDVHSQLVEWAMRTQADPKGSRSIVLRAMGRWGFIGSDIIRDNEKMGGAEVTLSQQTLEAMAAEDSKWLAEGRSAPPPAVGSHTNIRRYFHALWLLLNQTVTSQYPARIPRAHAHRVGRMPIPGTLTIVQLRRQEHRKADHETHVEWQHRWLVRGHWRWQPTSEGPKRIWINPYVKGPEGLPFAQTKKVYRLAR